MRGVTVDAPRGTTPGPTAVGRSFMALYALAFMSTSLVLVAPLLVTLALKVESLVGSDRAPRSLALVTGVGALVAMVGNPMFGRISDRTTSALGRRRPWMLVGLAGGDGGVTVVGLAPNVATVLAGLFEAQLFFIPLLADEDPVQPEHHPMSQRGLVSGILGVCLPTAAIAGTFLVQLFSGHQLAMFLAPCALGAGFIVLFAVVLDDPPHPVSEQPAWSLREVVGTFYVAPRKHADFAWAFASRFLFVLAYAFLVTYQTYFLLDRVGTAKDDVPHQLFLATLAQSLVVIVASVVGGRLSDRWDRRKGFVLVAALIYGGALFAVAAATSFAGFVAGMAVSGLGFGLYVAVDLALVTDVLPDRENPAKDLGVLNIAGALPFFVAPALAPAVLALGHESYAVLYAVAGCCAIGGAAAIMPIKGVR
jgi:MFS family permease